MTDLPTAAGTPDPDRITQSELDRLSLSVTDRFAPHVHAAEAAVREAEHRLTDAREVLARAEHETANRSYHSDPVVFMRATVSEDLEGLARKTTPKKVRASFRYLLARAAELAEGELASYQNDLADARWERDQGVAACRQAEQVALDELAAAQAMHQRVLDAEHLAREALDLLRGKMGSDPA